jgi:hypothetical protein
LAAAAFVLAAPLALGQTTEPVSWTNLVNVVGLGNNITRTSGTNTWNAGAVSTKAITGDGYMEFRAVAVFGTAERNPQALHRMNFSLRSSDSPMTSVR